MCVAPSVLDTLLNSIDKLKNHMRAPDACRRLRFCLNSGDIEKPVSHITKWRTLTVRCWQTIHQLVNQQQTTNRINKRIFGEIVCVWWQCAELLWIYFVWFYQWNSIREAILIHFSLEIESVNQNQLAISLNDRASKPWT